MRTITFAVKQQRIKPTSRVSHIYGGTDNYLKLEFDFDESWTDCAKAISFIISGSPEEVSVLLKDNSCTVPKEAFDTNQLKFYLVGKRKTDYRIQSQPFTIRIN